MNLISIGEVLWDVVGEAEYLGGAPLNFAAHAAKLGYGSYLVSAVGIDQRGNRALEQIQMLGLSTEYIRSLPHCPTGHVSVLLHDGGQPCFSIHRPAAYDFAQVTPEQLGRLVRIAPHWVYFGTLAQASSVVRSTTLTIIETVPAAKRFYDVNLRSGCYNRDIVLDLLSSATVTKLNEGEIEIVENLLGDTQNRSIEDFSRTLAFRFGSEVVCVTRGDKGCALLCGAEYVEVPAYSVRVVDTIGAGDAFSAGLVYALTAGWDAKRSAEFANRLGALVASRAGAIPAWSWEELEGNPQCVP